ncbi:MAG: Hsp20/alpha crystallin family protein [Candidatus Jacksonbacteria bacterium]
MSIIKWQPWLDVFDEVDDFFGNFPRRAISKSFAPAVNISQTESDVIVEVPLPGIDPDKVDITIENDVLIIQGKEEKQSEVEETNYTRREWVSQSFFRSIALPVSVQSDDADAQYDKGVLKIVIPKKPEAKAKKVAVKVK